MPAFSTAACPCPCAGTATPLLLGSAAGLEAAACAACCAATAPPAPGWGRAALPPAQEELEDFGSRRSSRSPTGWQDVAMPCNGAAGRSEARAAGVAPPPRPPQLQAAGGKDGAPASPGVATRPPWGLAGTRAKQEEQGASFSIPVGPGGAPRGCGSREPPLTALIWSQPRRTCAAAGKTDRPPARAQQVHI